VITEGALIDGRYRLDQPIGHGRAGVVWLAFDTQLHRTICAKPMYIPDGLDPAAAESARSRALREGRTACRVVHGCAIVVYDAVADSGNIWQFMEYVPSRTMDRFLSEHGNLTPQQTAYLGAQLASALAAAHTVGLAHGAVEPTNVLLADDGGVKLTDFGVSTPGPSAAFRAPERLHAGGDSPAADAFSLGCTLYRAVEGVPPFGVDGTAEQVPAHNAGVLTGVLLTLLRADPQSRPSLLDVCTELQALAAGTETNGTPTSQPPDAQPEDAQPTAVQPAARPTVDAQQQPQPPVASGSNHQPTQPTQPTHPAGNGQPLPQPQQPPQQPPQQARQQQQQRAPAAVRTPMSKTRREQLVAALAVALAIIVGIVFTEILVL